MTGNVSVRRRLLGDLFYSLPGSKGLVSQVSPILGSEVRCRGRRNMRQNQPLVRRHHFIPRFVLREFEDGEGLVWWTKTTDRDGTVLSTRPKNLFVKKDLYNRRTESGLSDDFEHVLAKKESEWSKALRRIKILVMEERDSEIEMDDGSLMLEYFLYAGIRTPEHLERTMYEGDHKPRELIDKVTNKCLTEEDYTRYEHNIRARLGSGQGDAVNAEIRELRESRGLAIFKLSQEANSLLVGSYGTALVKWKNQEVYFVPVAPHMALSCTGHPDHADVIRPSNTASSRMSIEMNSATWRRSSIVASSSIRALECTRNFVATPVAEP